jgi:nitroimidazol reductase NimA-like FMN-containing flavoprotein (pyridoxamine 5'-phosphate oxidase superfamily)
MQPEDGPAPETEASRDEARRILRTLLDEERVGVLSTHHDGAPYASLVAFVGAEDLSTILFATPRATRKFRNIEADSRVAVLIENTRGGGVDFEEAAAATATGRARELTGDERAASAERFADVHPHLRSFVNSPSTALLCVEVASYYVVRRFQHVTELHLDR